jgi:manganese/zinc/iron transport system substrate-binding protein
MEPPAMRPNPPALSATLLALALAGPAAAAEPLRVLATVGMIGDVAAEVAGDCARVETLLGPGVDPHDYSATPADVRRLAEAELILYVDAALEEQLARVLAGFADRTPSIGVLRAALGPGDLLADPDASGAPDPHIWMDVARWSRIVPVIAGAVIDLRPECADAVSAAAQSYGDKLTALHGWVGAAVATIPEAQRVLVTAHDAFNYFSDAYGIEASEAIGGISTAAEAGIADILAVADFVAARGVPAVFPETTINPRTVEALVQELAARGQTVAIGPALFSDAMGDADTPEGTYIGMIRANTVAIVEALGGTVPPLPEDLSPWADRWGLGG